MITSVDRILKIFWPLGLILFWPFYQFDFNQVYSLLIIFVANYLLVLTKSNQPIRDTGKFFQHCLFLIYCFVFFSFFLLYNDYVALFPDSASYLRAIQENFSLTDRSKIYSDLITPFFNYYGVTGVYLEQVVVTSFYLLGLQKLLVSLKQNYWLLLIALPASTVGFYLLLILPSAFTLCAVIGVILILAGNQNNFLAILTGCLLATHLATIPVLLISLVILICLFRYSREIQFRLGIVVFVACFMLTTSEAKKDTGLVFFSAQLLHSIPGSLESFCQEEPKDLLCQDLTKAEPVLVKSPLKFLWDYLVKQYQDGHQIYFSSSKKVVSFVIQQYPQEFLLMLVKNTLDLLLFRSEHDAVFRPRTDVDRKFKRVLGNEFAHYAAAKQRSGELLSKYLDYRQVSFYIYYFSLMTTLVYLLLFRRDAASQLYQMIGFIFIFAIINSCFMANISVSHFRYQEQFLILFLIMGALSTQALIAKCRTKRLVE